MKTKIIYLLTLVLFTFSAVGFCGDSGVTEDPFHHCIVCCDAGHYSCVPADAVIPEPFLTASRTVIMQDTSCQDLFVSGIDRPPQTTL